MNDRRIARRYELAIPVKYERPETAATEVPQGRTREISRSGLYFTADAAPEPGSMVTLTLTLPSHLTGGGDEVLVEVLVRILRIEPPEATADGRIGIAARIEKYEIVRASAGQAN
ncbi:MAG TPA: PilZ domain-containing protein [Candidatus Acidoferrales bacterium]|nr:PilZ domain-containing protein [Candidatus Acidoferrales bacterium]